MTVGLLLVSLLTFVELNCENLFDCRHDSLRADTEFLPEAPRHWTASRYWRKLDNIGRAILSCGEDSTDCYIPDLVALCEVENDTVLRDLTKRSLLRNARYGYVMTDSPDDRGIDVALLYHEFSFAPIAHASLRVAPVRGMRPTRDILYVAGRVITDDTLHIFVVHAPSRRGGERATRRHRLAVAGRLCEAIDSVRTVQPGASIIVAGDFNDYAADSALAYIGRHGMVNVTARARGSHYNPQIQIFAEFETKRPFFESSFKTKRPKKDLHATRTTKPEIRAKITLFRAWALSSTIQQAI